MGCSSVCQNPRPIVALLFCSMDIPRIPSVIVIVLTDSFGSGSHRISLTVAVTIFDNTLPLSRSQLPLPRPGQIFVSGGVFSLSFLYLVFALVENNRWVDVQFCHNCSIFLVWTTASHAGLYTGPLVCILRYSWNPRTRFRPRLIFSSHPFESLEQL